VYALIDRPVSSLDPDTRFLLDAMRAWVHALTLAGDPEGAVAGGFAGPGAGTRQAAFDRAMRALDQGSTDTLTFQRPCHPTVEEDEAVVLGLWALVQGDRIGAATAAARALLSPAAAIATVRAMAGYAVAG